MAIIGLIAMMLMAPLTLAMEIEEEIGTADLSVGVVTDQNINADFTGIADGDINNNIYCSAGGSCSTNIYGGTVNEGDDDENDTNIFNVNHYTSYVDNSNGGGFSIRDFVGRVAEQIPGYMNMDIPRRVNDYWQFLSVLDVVFVSHREYQPTFNNVMFLADEIDALKAELYLMKQDTGWTPDPEELACQTAINRALRTGEKTRTEDGRWVDLDETFGHTCVGMVTTIESTIPEPEPEPEINDTVEINDTIELNDTIVIEGEGNETIEE